MPSTSGAGRRKRPNEWYYSTGRHTRSGIRRLGESGLMFGTFFIDWWEAKSREWLEKPEVKAAVDRLTRMR